MKQQPSKQDKVQTDEALAKARLTRKAEHSTPAAAHQRNGCSQAHLLAEAERDCAELRQTKPKAHSGEGEDDRDRRNGESARSAASAAKAAQRQRQGGGAAGAR